MPDGATRVSPYSCRVDAVEGAALEQLDGVLEGEATVLEGAVAFVWVECNPYPTICVPPEIIFVVPEIAPVIVRRSLRRRRPPRREEFSPSPESALKTACDP